MRLIISICCFFLYIGTMQAQNISIKSLSFPGIAYSGDFGYFYGGGGFEIAYQHDLEKGRLYTGLEYRMIDWGNQTSLNLGHNLPYWSNDNFRFSETTMLHLGLALFQQKQLLVWGLSHILEIEWQSQKRFFATAGLGIRYSHAPKYKQYGSINSVLELPFQLGIGLRY